MPSSTEVIEITATPEQPISTATARNTDGARRNQMAVTTALTTGRPPLILPVIDELTVPSAIGFRRKGMAIHSADSTHESGLVRA